MVDPTIRISRITIVVLPAPSGATVLGSEIGAGTRLCARRYRFIESLWHPAGLFARRDNLCYGR
jgi:hypothetical protein